MKLLIRRVTPEDAEALLDIYAYYVKYTAISFEYDVPEVDEFRRRISSQRQKEKSSVLHTLRLFQTAAHTTGPLN